MGQRNLDPEMPRPPQHLSQTGSSTKRYAVTQVVTPSEVLQREPDMQQLQRGPDEGTSA